MTSRAIHFESQADDIERAKKFYKDTFGWQIKEKNHLKLSRWFFSTIRRHTNYAPDIKGLTTVKHLPISH